jgi:hypothetical protein
VFQYFHHPRLAVKSCHIGAFEEVPPSQCSLLFSACFVGHLHYLVFISSILNSVSFS